MEFTWPSEAENLLRENYGKPGWPAIRFAEEIGVSINSIHSKARRLGVAAKATDSDWTEENEAFLRQHYGTKEWSAEKIGERLGLTRNAVIGKAKRLRIVSSVKPGNSRVASPDAQRRHRKLPKDHPSRVAKKRRQFNFDSFNPPPKLRREAVQRVKPTATRMEGYAALGTSVEGCKWPGVAPGEVQCVALAVGTLPYCPEHCCRAYVVPVRR